MVLPQVMLARPERELAALDGVAEIKLDGYRCLAWHERGRAGMATRRGTRIEGRFPEVATTLLAELPAGSLVDGELVMLTGGRCDLGALSRRLAQGEARARAAARRGQRGRHRRRRAGRGGPARRGGHRGAGRRDRRSVGGGCREGGAPGPELACGLRTRVGRTA